MLRRGPKRSLLSITLTEGRNREIRRMLSRLGHKVRKLKRSAIGPLRDTGLAQLRRRIIETRTPAFADFALSPPSGDEPAAFVVGLDRERVALTAVRSDER